MKPLYRVQECLDIEFRKDDNPITSERHSMTHINQCIDVTLRKKAQREFGIGFVCTLWAKCFFEGTDLDGISDDIAMGYHNTFLNRC